MCAVQQIRTLQQILTLFNDFTLINLIIKEIALIKVLIRVQIIVQLAIKTSKRCFNLTRMGHFEFWIAIFASFEQFRRHTFSQRKRTLWKSLASWHATDPTEVGKAWFTIHAFHCTHRFIECSNRTALLHQLSRLAHNCARALVPYRASGGAPSQLIQIVLRREWLAGHMWGDPPVVSNLKICCTLSFACVREVCIVVIALFLHLLLRGSLWADQNSIVIVFAASVYSQGFS